MQPRHTIKTTRPPSSLELILRHSPFEYTPFSTTFICHPVRSPTMKFATAAFSSLSVIATLVLYGATPVVGAAIVPRFPGSASATAALDVSGGCPGYPPHEHYPHPPPLTHKPQQPPTTTTTKVFPTITYPPVHSVSTTTTTTTKLATTTVTISSKYQPDY